MCLGEVLFDCRLEREIYLLIYLMWRIGVDHVHEGQSEVDEGCSQQRVCILLCTLTHMHMSQLAYSKLRVGVVRRPRA